MKLATIDFEGDALDKSINQRIFPKGCHFDPGTRVWCATISYDYEGQMFTNQYVTKLNGTRELRNEDGTFIFDANKHKLRTKATHEKDTKVPLDLYKGREHITVIECLTEHELYDSIRIEIVSLLSQDYTICSKGYGKYNYDNMLFLTLMNRYYKDERDETIDIYNHANCYNLITNVANTKLDNVHTVSQLWKPTHKQVSKGQSIPNQQYLEHGMKHNLEDCENLFNLIAKYYKVWDKRRSIEDDFR